jgi:tRNA pseudouridine32 synthase/23S rRNA pseudouridine746 synthase
MGAILPPYQAKAPLDALFDSFDATGHITPAIDTQTLLTDRGKMFGILIAEDEHGTKHTLKAFSGCLASYYEIDGFVPPAFPVKEFEATMLYYSDKVKEIQRREQDTLLPPVRKETAKQQHNEDSFTLQKQLKKERTRITTEALQSLRKLYSFHCIDKKQRTFSDMRIEAPPTGTGDCCAPKLLSYAFSRGFKPLSLLEGYYGKDAGGKIHRHYYPPCRTKCALILPFILGLDIVYCDDFITVVNKKEGLLTLEGLHETDSLNERIHAIFPSSLPVSAVHRLDMDTSGLVLVAREKQCFSYLSRQFQKKTIKKTYIAKVRGVVKTPQGIIDLPLAKNAENPLIQEVRADGKKSVTRYERLAIKRNSYNEFETRLLLTPQTGRSHQLRVHCRTALFPIVGDRLYGQRKEGEKRMLLHANSICFRHPVTHTQITIESPSPF